MREKGSFAPVTWCRIKPPDRACQSQIAVLREKLLKMGEGPQFSTLQPPLFALSG
jgi:hypothetical protein